MQYKKYTLRNGLRVILVPAKEMTTATFFVIAGTGSRYEDAHENGLAHFLEHMFFKGTKRRPTAAIIARELDALGASFNAYTGQERTAYYAKVAADKILPAMDVISDLYLHATLDAREIKKESGAIIQEINMYEDMPARTVQTVFDELLYGADHPLGRPILGPKENVLRFTRRDFINYLARCYSAKNTTVVVAGNFPQTTVLAKIRKDFSSMEGGTKPTYQIFENTQKTPHIAIKQKKTDQTHFLLGVHTPGFSHKDRYVLSVLANILGGSMSSRLFSEVREKRGLAYHISASVEFYPETGALAVHAGVEHDNLEKAIKIILKEMKDIAKNGVTREEFKRAQSGYAGRTSFGYETSDDIAQHFGEQETIHGEIVLPHEILRRINRVTRAQIKRVARDIFVNEKLNLAIIGPHKKNEKTLKTLLRFS